jgi:hypothetical protein
MHSQAKVLLSLAAVSLLVATIAGAVGTHALPLDEQALRSFETAVRFQFFHGLGVIALVLVALLRQHLCARVRRAGRHRFDRTLWRCRVHGRLAGLRREPMAQGPPPVTGRKGRRHAA